MSEPRATPWLPDEEYTKAVGQLRMQLSGVLEPFDMYGQGVYIPTAVSEIVKLAEDFGLRVRGVDKPIDLGLVRNNGHKKSKLRLNLHE